VFSFEKSRRCDDNQQTTVTHFGENKRLHVESSKQNYYIVSFGAIIKAIFTSKPGTRIPKNQRNQIKGKTKRSSLGSTTPSAPAGK